MVTAGAPYVSGCVGTPRMPNSSIQLRWKESAELRMRFMRTKPILASLIIEGVNRCVSPRVSCVCESDCTASYLNACVSACPGPMSSGLLRVVRQNKVFFEVSVWSIAERRHGEVELAQRGIHVIS